jgi:hypothetical protein
MKRTLVFLGILLIAVALFSTGEPPPRYAFAASGVIIVNPGCGTPSPLPSTGQQVTYVDANGARCVNSGGGGGGTVTTATACTGTPIAINQTASTDVYTSTNKMHICSIVLVSATQQGFSLSEGTGSTCASGTALLMGGAGGTMQLAANGGFSATSGVPWLQAKNTADHLCLLQSSTGNISGTITLIDN